MNSIFSNTKSLILLIFIFLLFLFLDLLAVKLYYDFVSEFLEQQPENFQADAGIVFFGDYTEDKKEIGPESQQRALKAIQLYNSGIIETIVCVGGYPYETWSGKPHLMSRFLIRNGIPTNNIYYDTISYNTITNWEEAQKIIQKNNFKKIVAISAPLHIYRISRLIHNENIYFSSYKYRLNNFSSLWRFYLDVHHEWRSHLLSMVLKDGVRNKLVFIYRVMYEEFKQVF